MLINSIKPAITSKKNSSFTGYGKKVEQLATSKKARLEILEALLEAGKKNPEVPKPVMYNKTTPLVEEIVNSTPVVVKKVSSTWFKGLKKQLDKALKDFPV